MRLLDWTTDNWSDVKPCSFSNLWGGGGGEGEGREGGREGERGREGGKGNWKEQERKQGYN